MSRITRESETRTHETRPTFNMDYASPLSLPPGAARDGFYYRWGRIHVKGDNDFRIEELMQQGWTPVPTDRVPSYVNLDPLGRNPLGNKFIIYKDAMLLEKEARLVNERIRQYDEYNVNKIKSLKGVTNDLGGFGKPIVSINSF